MVRVEIPVELEPIRVERPRSATPTRQTWKHQQQAESVFSDSASEVQADYYDNSDEDDDLESVTDSHIASEADTEATINDIFSDPGDDWDQNDESLWSSFYRSHVERDDMARQAASMFGINNVVQEEEPPEVTEQRQRDASWRQQGWEYLKRCRDMCYDGAANAVNASAAMLSITEIRDLLTHVPEYVLLSFFVDLQAN